MDLGLEKWTHVETLAQTRCDGRLGIFFRAPWSVTCVQGVDVRACRTASARDTPVTAAASAYVRVQTANCCRSVGHRASSAHSDGWFGSTRCVCGNSVLRVSGSLISCSLRSLRFRCRYNCVQVTALSRLNCNGLILRHRQSGTYVTLEIGINVRIT